MIFAFPNRNRRISTPRLNILLCLDLVPINLIISQGPQMISNLGIGFPLRCFQRLSMPDIAAQQCHWRDSWQTRGQFTPVLSSLIIPHFWECRLYLHPLNQRVRALACYLYRKLFSWKQFFLI